MKMKMKLEQKLTLIHRIQELILQFLWCCDFVSMLILAVISDEVIFLADDVVVAVSFLDILVVEILEEQELVFSSSCSEEVVV